MNGPGFMLPTTRMLDNYHNGNGFTDDSWRYKPAEPEIKLTGYKPPEPITFAEPTPLFRPEPVTFAEPTPLFRPEPVRLVSDTLADILKKPFGYDL